MAEKLTTTVHTSDTSPTDIKARLKASYDAIAPKYNDWTIPHSTTRLHFLSQLLSRLSTTSPVSVLELGCGCGLPVTQKLLSHENFTVTGNDLSSAQCALTRENLPSERLTVIEGDMLGLDIATGSQDAVIGMYSIIHLHRTEHVDLLTKIEKWLKPGGWLLANFAAEESESNEMRNWLGEEKGWMFWSGWGGVKTAEKVQEIGFSIVVQEEVEDVVDAKFLWILAQKPEK